MRYGDWDFANGKLLHCTGNRMLTKFGKVDFEKKDKLVWEIGSIPPIPPPSGSSLEKPKNSHYVLVFFQDFTSICCPLDSYFYPLFRKPGMSFPSLHENMSL